MLLALKLPTVEKEQQDAALQTFVQITSVTPEQ